jgi:acyl-coenzyme A synthetase/AMP-(fatty) acid ligase
MLHTDVPADDLIAHCRARLAPFEVPKELHRVAELPRGATGKLMRAQLGTQLTI